MRNWRNLSLFGQFVMLSLLLAGCTMAPAYHRPAAPIPNTYGYGTAGIAAANIPMWKEFFADPALQRLIPIAIANNRDLRIALLNIEKTRQQYRIQRADLLPTVAAAAQEQAVSTPPEFNPPFHKRTITHQYSATLAFSGYELDIFGRIRSMTDQVLETHYSLEEEAKAAQLSLVAEVTGVYLQLVADRENLAIIQATVDNRKQHLRLVEQRAKAGVASSLEVEQAKSNYEQVRSLAAQAKAKVGQDENFLALLLGSPIPADLPYIDNLAQVKKLPDIPAGVSSELLERRPDIKAAEHRLKGANANIGAARANFFPRIVLTGSYGTMTLDYKNLFKSGTEGWSFLPQISLPIFDTGRNIALLGAANEEKRIAVAQYEKTIQQAFKEVADALAMRQQMTEILSAEEKRLQAAKNTFSIATQRYNAGIDNHIILLNAQTNYLAAQQNFIGTLLLKENNALTVYKALGGGWK